MCQHDDIDEARAALIDQRIGQAFAFLGDVIEDVHLLDTIPDGSRLAFRDVAIGRFHFRLTAYLPPTVQDQWNALVTGYRIVDEPDRSGSHHKPIATKGPTSKSEPASVAGKTATLALDALETKLRTLIAIPA